MMRHWRVLLSALMISLPWPAPASVADAPVSSGPLLSLTRVEAAKPLLQRRLQPASVHVPLRQWVTEDGLRVAWLHTPQLPMLDARLIYDAGAARDGSQPGLATALTSLLDEGTEVRDAQAVAEGFEQLGAVFSASSFRDMAMLQLRVLSEPGVRDAAMALLAEVASRPALTEQDWLRQQESMRIGQRQRQQSPAGRAGLLFFQKLYGDHPYANPPGGLAAAIERMRIEDIRAFHRRYFSRQNAVLVLVGDLSLADAEVLARQVSVQLPAGQPAPALPPVPALTKAIRHHENFASQQVHVILGEVGISRQDPDYYALTVANELLGGSGFGTLLMRELREKRGLTYGVSSQFALMREAGPFQIAFSTRADQAEAALELTQSLLRRFVQEGPAAAEVARAKQNLMQSFPRYLASNDQLASYLGLMAFYGLPGDYLDQYLSRLAAVTPEQVRDAVSRRLHPDRMLVVTVGPAPATAESRPVRAPAAEAAAAREAVTP